MAPEKERLWGRVRFGLAILACACLLAPLAQAQEGSGEWLLNPEDGSEKQVKSRLEGAEALLHPEAQAPQPDGSSTFVVPETRGEGYPHLDVPHPAWHYDTDYFFGLSRGLFREDVPGVVKGLSLIGTVPLDLAGLPAATLAGLFGT